MKVLLDESIPQKLKSYFPDIYEIFTVQQMGWSGNKNGDLLQLARSDCFSALVTVDRGFEFQHNLKNLAVPVIIMIAPSIHLHELYPLVPKVVSILSSNPKCAIYRVLL